MKRVPILFTTDTSSSGQILTELYRRTEEVLVKISQLEDVKAVATAFHQKVMNKKFFDALKERNPCLHGSIALQVDHHKFHVFTSTIQNYYRSELLNMYNCEYAGIIVNNRLDANAMIKFVSDMQDSLWKQWDKLWEDIRTGEERLNQYNQLVSQLNELRNTFSTDFVSLRNLDFKTALRP